MADEPTSADPDALGRFVDTGAKLRSELGERTGELDALVRWVESGSSEFGVSGMAALVDRVAALAAQWGVTESRVAAVRDALVAADASGVGGDGLPTVSTGAVLPLMEQRQAQVVADLAADLVASGMTEALAAAIAADTVRLVTADPSLKLYAALRRASAAATGVSEDELDRRGRAFGLSRAGAVAVLGAHWEEAERASGGYGKGVTRDGLRAVADDERAPGELRDAAYRLASDPGLFNDLDAAARTRGVTATGFDRSQTDGLIGRSDVDGFARRDAQIRVVLPWRLLLDTAADGFRLSGADGVIRARDVDRFVHDRRVPVVVRQAAWDLYAESDPDLVRGLDGFEPTDDERGDNGLLQAAERGFVTGVPLAGRSSWLTVGRPPGPASSREPASGGSGAAEAGTGGAGFAGLVAGVVAMALEPVVDAGVDQATAAWDRIRSPGMPGTFVVFNPHTGQPVAVSSEALDGLAGDDAIAAVFWAAATGLAPGAGSAWPPGPVPDGAWVDEAGVWRDGTTHRPLVGEPRWAAAAEPGEPQLIRAPLRNPRQYEDLNGDLRWRDTNELVSQRPNRTWYEDDDGVWRWSDTRKPVEAPVELPAPASSRPMTSAELGAAREIAVARLVGGTVLGEPGGPGMMVEQPNVGKTDVDVLGLNGEYIVVGGPAKGRDLPQFIKKLHILRYAATQAGVRPIAYFDEGTPDEVLRAAEKVLGADSVRVERLVP